jgi:hypothetical protein
MTGWDRTIAPTEDDLIRGWIEHHLADVHTSMPARVQSYDAASQTATLVPLVRHAVLQGDGSVEREELPVLPSVPVLWPRFAGHFVAGALAAGDVVLVVFCESDTGPWRAGSGDVSNPADLRRHSLSHGVAIPGLAHGAGALQHAPAATGTDRLVIGDDADEGTRITLRADGTVLVARGTAVQIQVDPDGTVHLGGAPAATKLLALAELVDARLASVRSAYNAHVHAETGVTTGPPTALLGALTTTAGTKARGA